MGETAAIHFVLWISTLYILLSCRASPLTGRQTCRFKCLSGECIGVDKYECDGIVDCPDGSDETSEACSSMKCPDYADRCDYGGCIDGNSWCNGVVQCADSSDENNCPASPPKKCKSGEFQCGTGSCISSTEQCDGKQDCSDGSDETVAACKNFPCPRYSFRCNYGGCIDVTGQCDGVPQCADGSDEKPPVCSDVPNITSPLTRTTNEPIDFKHESFVCDPLNNRFEPPPPSDCREVSTSGGTPFILQGDQAEPGEFPWLAAIYKFRDEKYTNICGGTLVSLKLIISAAHCFWDGNRLDETKHYKIVLGKYHSDWNVTDEGQQRFDVAQFHINCYYKHREKYYDYDIAAVILRGEVKLSDKIFPICIDWGQKYRISFTRGMVAGWGTTENNQPPDTLRKASLPLVDVDLCRKSVPKEFVNYLSRGKFCAGYTNGTGVCFGDSGSGLVFTSEETNAWYLKGIVSAGVKLSASGPNICSHKDYALFTDVYEFLPWLRKIYV